MKKLFLLPAVAACCLWANAQVEIVSQKSVLSGGETGYNPVLNSDGSKLLYTTSDYTGLKCFDFGNNSIQTIADDSMSGFSPVFSKDGKNVYFLSQTVEHQMVYRSLKNYSFSGGTSVLVEKARGLGHPVAIDGGFVANSSKGKMQRTKRQQSSFVMAHGDKLLVAQNGVEKELSPVATNYTYMWESLSPDGTKILFYAGGKGAFVCNLDGTIVTELGKLTVPVWLDDNHVVAQRSTHDGHQYESSQIVVVDIRNNDIVELTSPVSMAMNPTAAPQKGRIAYNTVDGRIYIMDLVIK